MAVFFKRLLQKINRLSIVAKLILTFLLLLAPLYALNFFINDTWSAQNKQETQKLLTNSVHSYGNLLETELLRIVDGAGQSAVDIAVLYAALPQEASLSSQPEYLLEVRRHLNNLQDISRFVKEIKIYFLKTSEIIGTNSSSIQPIDPADAEQLSLARSSNTFVYDGHFFLSVPYVYETETSSGLFVITVEVNETAVQLLMDNMNRYQSSNVIFHQGNEGWFITSKSQPPIPFDIDTLNSRRNVQCELDHLTVNDRNIVLVSEYFPKFQITLALYADTSEVFKSASTYRTFFILMLLLTILIILLFSLSLYHLVHRPLNKLVTSFKKVEQGDFSFQIDYPKQDEFGYLYESFNKMQLQLDTLVHEVYEQKIRNQHSELKRLQSQINPHFLYNSFFVLYRLIKSENTELSLRFSSYLGNYFQYITRDSSDEILLKDEIAHARTYTDIQTLCHGGRIQVTFGELEESLSQITVPRLILQPIIENCYKHAFENTLEKGQLSVSFHHDAQIGMIEICVEDNGQCLTDSALEALQKSLSSRSFNPDEITGIYNVHRRILLKYGSGCGLSISRSPMGGMKVQIRIKSDHH